LKSIKVFIISDTHFPFHNKEALKEVVKLIKQEKPTHIIQIGDLLDWYSFSKYSRSHNFTTPKDEVARGLKDAATFWRKIRKIAPRAKCYQVLGNHDVRLKKRITERLPELSGFYSEQALYQFPGVKTLKSDRDYLKIDGVIYTHGWLSKSIDHANYFGKPVVHGHRHRPAIETKGTLWSMDVGYLAQKDSLPLSYTPTRHSNWTLACGVVHNRQPKLILLKG